MQLALNKLSNYNPLRLRSSGWYFIAFILFAGLSLQAENIFTAEDLMRIREVSEVSISPDGKRIAYTVNVPRKADDKPGSAYRELYVISSKTGEIQPYITGKERIRSISWSPDGSYISFLSNRHINTVTQVWAIPAEGGEARQVTDFPTSVKDYRWYPAGGKLAFIAETPSTEKEKKLETKGYDFVFYEEDWKHLNLYIIDFDRSGMIKEPVQVTEGKTVWEFEFSPDGEKAIAKISPMNLVDYKYMFTDVYEIDLSDKTVSLLVDVPGKLGNVQYSPDGSHIAYTAAKERKDHAVSQVYVKSLSGGGEPENLTVEGFRGHVEWVSWLDKNTVIYRSGEGTATTLSKIAIDAKTGDERTIIVSSERNAGCVFENPSISKNGKYMAFTGSSPDHPDEVFFRSGNTMKRLTNVNPWLDEKTLGAQEVLQYPARDGVTIEGILIKPAGYEEGQEYPLVVIVHGGPESHYSNGWMSSYSRPGQVFANDGYLVFYPNYRSSTGYGLDYAMTGYNDAAGTEFDDIADGIDYIVNSGMADKDRVGLAGGSYGGFAAAWFSSFYTDKVKAVGMFVGISNLISKRGTTDIPYEELYVHSGKKLEEMWDQSLKRSPVYYAHQSKTAVLIYGGLADTRVEPSQSLEYYRRLKMNDHPAVRLVRYPGEGHGNSKQPGRIDVCLRLIDWFNWYVKENKPVDGPMPPLDISDKYGLDLN